MQQGGLLSLLGIDPRDKRDQRNRLGEIDAQSRGQLAVENARQQGMANIAKINNDATLSLAEKNRLTQIELEKLKHVQATEMVTTEGNDQRKTIGVTGSENRLSIQATGKENRLGTETTGAQERLTNKDKSKSERKLERVRASEGRLTDNNKRFNAIAESNAAASNKQRELERMQALNVAGANNFISAPLTENERVFSGATMDPMLKGKVQELELGNQVRATPQYATTFGQGMNANNLKSVFDNLQKGSVQVGPGNMGLFPPSGSAAPPTDLNKWNQAQGSSIDETMQTSNFVTQDGTSIPLSSEVVRKNIPGRVRVPQNILQQAAQQQLGVQPSPPSAAFNPSVNPEMQAILRQILQSQGQ